MLSIPFTGLTTNSMAELGELRKGWKQGVDIKEVEEQRSSWSIRQPGLQGT